MLLRRIDDARNIVDDSEVRCSSRCDNREHSVPLAAHGTVNVGSPHPPVVTDRDLDDVDVHDTSGMGERRVRFLRRNEGPAVGSLVTCVGQATLSVKPRRDESRQVSVCSALNEHSTRCIRKSSLVGEESKYFILRINRTGPFEPRTTEDARRGHDEVEKNGCLGGCDGNERDHRWVIRRHCRRGEGFDE